MEKFNTDGLGSEYRHVRWTGEHSQLVSMSLVPGQEIGSEVHPVVDQLFVFVSGTGTAEVGDESEDVGPGDVVAVPAGTVHNIINTGSDPLVLVTVYSPPNHPADRVQAEKPVDD
jgi:mannose-6-phosphate isomerase-like protein (cupin superfamily)